MDLRGGGREGEWRDGLMSFLSLSVRFCQGLTRVVTSQISMCFGLTRCSVGD